MNVKRLRIRAIELVSRMSGLSIVIGRIRAVTPRTNVAFEIILPKVSPITMSPWRFTAAEMSKESSGSDVPRARTKSPIRMVGMPKAVAISVLERMRISALARRAARPNPNRNSCFGSEIRSEWSLATLV